MNEIIADRGNIRYEREPPLILLLLLSFDGLTEKSVGDLQMDDDMNYDIIANKDYTPSMHTAEHILNQTMVRLYNCGRAFSAHIEKKKSKCDYRFDHNLSENEIKEIEEKVNLVISGNYPVFEEFMTRDEAGKFFNLDRLPETAGERLRVMKVGDYDSCLCSGKHCSNTSEIKPFKIISTGFENGVLRIRFKLAD